MTSPVHARPIPARTRIADHVAGAHFHDCYEVEVDAEPPRTALGHFLATVARTPAWVESMMRLRNRAVRLVGLKDLGTLARIGPAKPESAYLPGDRVGIFTLRSNSPDEVVVADDDKHLEVFLSVVMLPVEAGCRPRIALSTVVHVHNLLGHLYMLPVTPMHKLITRAVLARAAAGVPR